MRGLETFMRLVRDGWGGRIRPRWLVLKYRLAGLVMSVFFIVAGEAIVNF